MAIVVLCINQILYTNISKSLIIILLLLNKCKNYIHLALKCTTYNPFKECWDSKKLLSDCLIPARFLLCNTVPNLFIAQKTRVGWQHYKWRMISKFLCFLLCVLHISALKEIFGEICKHLLQ